MDFHGCDDREALLEYQRLGLALYASQGPGAVLLMSGNVDAVVHYALRDILCTVARVVERPLRLRLAVLGSGAAIEQVCHAMRFALRAAGCELRLFAAQGEAVQWLLAGEQRVSVRAVACAATP